MLRVLGGGCAALLVVAIAFACYSWREVLNVCTSVLESAGILALPGTARVQVREVELHIDGLPHSLNNTRIVQLSDLHRHDRNGSLMELAVEASNALQPDLIVLTGDYIQYDPQPIIPLSAELSKLRATHGVYASLGNHDVAKRGAKSAVKDALAGVGIRVLENESVRPFAQQQELVLVGMGEWWERGAFQPERAFAGVGAGDTAVVLSHNPDTVIPLAGYPADVILCGHTHGGSVRLPFLGSLLPYLKWMADNLPEWIVKRIPYSRYSNVIQHAQFSEGTHSVQRRTPTQNATPAGPRQNHVHISRGVGSHPHGFRIFCDPEVSLITLRAS
eukprot:TRINITY_DN26349_c0_g1_i1.p1 TRINITY_DN26349_c0_g1~~TRINITY_DN26349_c0_g1_i1.p1  ORF type:complete len:332 (+),score=46.40 TRINITY_DN26349_c0_g1_i1:196-1191(+)